jgi:hypothetical protein
MSMVSRILINAIDCIAFCILMLPILFIGFSGDPELAGIIAVAAVICRLILQMVIRNKLPADSNVIPGIRMYKQSFNVMWFTMFGSVALILADGELFATMRWMLLVIIVWAAFQALMYWITSRNSGNDDENNDENSSAIDDKNIDETEF